MHNMEEETLINRVANSGLMTIDLEQFFPTKQIFIFDIKDYLFHGLILKEKDFREALKQHDWQQYNGSILCVFCSTDAIIPVWAYMLISSSAGHYNTEIYVGNKEEYLKHYYNRYIATIDGGQYQDERVVIKGCSDKPVPPSAYADIQIKLQPYAQSVMYGEPCSTVPVFKRARKLEKE